MNDILVTTRKGAAVGIAAADVDEFSGRLRGTLIRRAEAAYNAACPVWNGSVDWYPALIAQCDGAADVVSRCSSPPEHDPLVAVRTGAHNAGHVRWQR